MKKIFWLALVTVGVAGCSGGSSGGSAASTNVYSITPGITDLDSSTPAIDKASYYTVISSSSSENKVTVGGTATLGSFSVPAGQNFVVESKKKLQFSGPANAELKLGGTFNLPAGAQIKVELVWATNEKSIFRFVGNNNRVEMYSENISPAADSNAYADQFIMDFPFTDFSGIYVSKSSGTMIQAGYFDANGNDTSVVTLSDTGHPNKLATDAYMKITVSNPSASIASFSLSRISTTFPGVNRP